MNLILKKQFSNYQTIIILKEISENRFNFFQDD